jgi:hypothetical protein
MPSKEHTVHKNKEYLLQWNGMRTNYCEDFHTCQGTLNDIINICSIF